MPRHFLETRQEMAPFAAAAAPETLVGSATTTWSRITVRSGVPRSALHETPALSGAVLHQLQTPCLKATLHNRPQGLPATKAKSLFERRRGSITSLKPIANSAAHSTTDFPAEDLREEVWTPKLLDNLFQEAISSSPANASRLGHFLVLA
eukprot:m.182862 g.182862  ORF g.182862 m.182862 type:complete len:150 (-) comp14676_c0_seq3:763-1212(-)